MHSWQPQLVTSEEVGAPAALGGDADAEGPADDADGPAAVDGTMVPPIPCPEPAAVGAVVVAVVGTSVVVGEVPDVVADGDAVKFDIIGCKGGVEVVPLLAIGPGGPVAMSPGDVVGPETMLCRLGGAVEMTNGEGAVAVAFDVRLPPVAPVGAIWRRRGACSEQVRMRMSSQLGSFGARTVQKDIIVTLSVRDFQPAISLHLQHSSARKREQAKWQGQRAS